MNNGSKKISIVIPVYNTQDYLERCLDSVVNQAYKNFEIVIINDASTDDSQSTINSFCDKHKNIKCITLTNNAGVGNARNIGLQNSTGDYVGFVDSDDWIDVNMYNNMINTINTCNAEIAVCGIKNEHNNFVSSSVRYSYEVMNVIDTSYALNLLCRVYNTDNLMTPMVCNKLYRSSFIKESNLNFLTNSFFEDDVFTFISFLQPGKVALVPDTYYHYYQRPDSITHKFSKRYIDNLVNAFAEIKRKLTKDNIFEKYSLYFAAYFEKCTTSALSTLFMVEPNLVIQKKYLKYFSLRMSDVFSCGEIFDYLDIQRIKKFLNL